MSLVSLERVGAIGSILSIHSYICSWDEVCSCSAGATARDQAGGRQIPDGYTPKAFLNELTDGLQLPLNITCMFYEWDQTNWLLENKSSSQDGTIMAPEKKKPRHYRYLALHISPNSSYILKGGGNKAWENIEAFISLANTSDQNVVLMLYYSESN